MSDIANQFLDAVNKHLDSIKIRACSASVMVIGWEGVWFHPGSRTPCTHEGEPQETRWVSGGLPLEATDAMIDVFSDEQCGGACPECRRDGLKAVLALVPRSVPDETLLKEAYDKGYRQGTHDTATEKEVGPL